MNLLKQVDVTKEQAESAKLAAISLPQWKILLDSNPGANSHYYDHSIAGKDFHWVIGVGVEGEIKSARNFPASWKDFIDRNPGYKFGFLSYELKNRIEKLESKNPDYLCFPEIHWWNAKFIIIYDGKSVSIFGRQNPEWIDTIFERKNISENFSQLRITLQSRTSKKEYIENVNRLKQHIQRGDIYEINYCIELFAANVVADPFDIWKNLSVQSPMPFSAFVDMPEYAIISASPERFMKKAAQKLIMQPMKGTIRRGCSSDEDEKLRRALHNDPKEQSENVMIVDIVRNDLSRTAKKGSVKVEELFGIQTFAKAHQMVSTISSELRNDFHSSDAITAAFPMASMTGAPKIRAMELIDQFENFTRGPFSGSLGYMDSVGNFDLNVLIRSVFFNKASRYLSICVGSAITINSNPEKEFEECKLKAAPVLAALGVEFPA